MGVTLRIPTVLRKLTDGRDEVEAAGSNVGEVLRAVGERYPAFLEKVTSEGGAIRPFLNVFVNGEDIRFAGDLEAPVSDGDEVSIIPSVAGGR